MGLGGWRYSSSSTAEPLDRFLADRSEEIHEVAVGVAEQDGAVSPRHGGWFLHPVGDEWLQARVLGVDVVDAELDNYGVIVSRARGVGPEQLHRLGVADRERAGRQNDLGEYGRGALRWNTRDLFIELDEPIQVVGDDAYRREIHKPSSLRRSEDKALRYRSVAILYGDGNLMTPKTTRRQPTAQSAPARSTRLDSRVERSQNTVLTAAFELLSESGVGGFSVDEVARRSGVAKTTIYRHWPTREALVIDACSRISAEQTAPDTGSLEGDLTAILTDIAHLLETANWSSVLPSIVDIAERDPEFADIHSKIQRGHAAPLREVLDRAVHRGELPADADLSTLVAALLGPLFYRRWFSREAIDDRFVRATINRVIATP